VKKNTKHSHSHEDPTEVCLFQKECEVYHKSIKELTKLYEDMRRRYEILNLKSIQELNT